MRRQGELFEHSPYMDPAAAQRLAMARSTGYVTEEDSDVRGLGLRTTARGVRAWVLAYQHQGRTRHMTIGRLDAWPLAVVREEACRLRRLIDQGGDPLAERQAAQQAMRKPLRTKDGIRPGWGRVQHVPGPPYERWEARWVDESAQRHSKTFKDPDRAEAFRSRMVAEVRKKLGIRKWVPSPRTRAREARILQPSPTAPEARVTTGTDPQVLEALTAIQHAQKAQDASLARLQQDKRDAIEHGPMILRRLTELERLIRGGDLHISPKTTRRRPLGA